MKPHSIGACIRQASQIAGRVRVRGTIEQEIAERREIGVAEARRQAGGAIAVLAGRRRARQVGDKLEERFTDFAHASGKLLRQLTGHLE